MGKDGKYLDINHSAPLVARKVLGLIKSLFPTIETQVLVQRARARKNQIFTVRVLTQNDANLVHSTLIYQKYIGSDPSVLAKRCCRRAYIRGAFLSHGSVTNPEKNYHLEIFTEKTEVANRIVATINSLELDARLTTRKNNMLVYLKDSDEIVTLLNLMGAHHALLRLENVRVVKDMRNQVNRLVNCETANVDKTVQAAMVQTAEIEKIVARIGLDELPPKLQEIAQLRLENPYASLKELGELCQPLLSKSGVNYRMRQLLKLSEQFSDELE